MKKRILIVLYFLYILIINHNFIISNRVTLLIFFGGGLIDALFNATFSNISAISWRPVLVVEEAGVPGENHRPRQATGNLYHMRLQSSAPFFVTYKANPRRIGDRLV